MELVIPPPAPTIEYKSGLYYGPFGFLTTSAPPNATERCVPFYLPRRYSLDSIGIETTVNGEAGSLVRLGIRANAPGGTYPGDLVVDAGTVAGDGGAAFKPLAIAVTVGPGVVWLAVTCQVAATTRPTLRTINTADYSGHVGFATGFVTATSMNGYAQTGVTGALAPTFSGTVIPAPAAFAQVRFV